MIQCARLGVDSTPVVSSRKLRKCLRRIHKSTVEARNVKNVKRLIGEHVDRFLLDAGELAIIHWQTPN